MELNYNYRPRFTEWVIGNRLLESPFVLIDVGVQGGVHPRWGHLGDSLEVHGFDALDETIAALKTARRQGHHYYTTALGDKDGRTTLFVPANKFAASLSPRELAAEQERLRIDPRVSGAAQQRDVPMTRLDTLMREGLIPPADFLKMDCEGSEPAILAGAAALLSSGTLLGIQSETSLVSTGAAQPHFSRILEQLRPHGFRVADLAVGRFAYRSFAARAATLGREQAIASAAGPIGALDVLFVRDLTAEPESVGPDAILKSAVMLELYGLNDVAHDLLTTLAARLPAELDIARQADRLIYRVPAPQPGISTVLRDLGAALRRSLRFRHNRRGLRGR